MCACQEYRLRQSLFCCCPRVWSRRNQGRTQRHSQFGQTQAFRAAGASRTEQGHGRSTIRREITDRGTRARRSWGNVPVQNPWLSSPEIPVADAEFWDRFQNTSSLQGDPNPERQQGPWWLTTFTGAAQDAFRTTENRQLGKNVEEHVHQQVHEIVKDADMTSLKKNEKWTVPVMDIVEHVVVKWWIRGAYVVVKWWIGGHHREINVAKSPGLDQCIHWSSKQPCWPAQWIGQTNSFFWADPVSRLLERLTDVPLKLKKRNNVREIEVDLKWMFSLASCGFIRMIPCHTHEKSAMLNSVSLIHVGQRSVKNSVSCCVIVPGSPQGPRRSLEQSTPDWSS